MSLPGRASAAPGSPQDPPTLSRQRSGLGKLQSLGCLFYEGLCKGAEKDFFFVGLRV